MNRNKHLLLWTSLGALAMLVYAAVEENFLREWRAIQKTAHGASGPVDVRLRQIIAPKLHATDRCVSCHVGMSPGETAVAGDPILKPHPPVHHDPAEFGCTVCHGGQGRATDKDAAHGDVHFWPEPMIPVQYAYAGCGACHTHIHVPAQAQLAVGQRLVERFDCLTCHRIDGRGGTIRPGQTPRSGPFVDQEGMPASADVGRKHGPDPFTESPDLSAIGQRGYSADWYAKHLAKHDTASDGPWKDSFGKIDAAERDAIGVYLASRVGAPRLVEAKALFHSLGCRGCHKVGGVGGDDGADLTLAGQKDPGRLDFSHVPGSPTIANWTAEHLRHPAKVVPGSQMPEMGLSESEIDLLTHYIFSLRRSGAPEALWPKDRIQAERFGEREFAADGATLFGTFCAACHGREGQGQRFPGMPVFPSIANPDFLAVATDEFIAATVRGGRPGKRMPAWGEKEGGLKPDEIERVVGHLRHLGRTSAPTTPERPARSTKGDAVVGQRLFAQRCASCHGAKGEGIEAPALNNRVLLSAASDTYLFETIRRGRRGTPMNGFGLPSTVYSTLSENEIEALVAYIRTFEESSR